MSHFDIIIAGGSISGLLAAREAARSGLSVAVLEDDAEVGTPEHCGGLVSAHGIRDMGIIPDACAIENEKITRAKISSPTKGFEIDSRHQNVVVLDRRALDKQVALQAQKAGAEIRVRCAVRGIDQSEHFTIKTSDGEMTSDFFVDARGVASIITKKREAVFQSAQYEVFAPWIERDTIEVDFDSDKYPGFFAWVIPTAEGCGKVGVAGRGINAAKVLDSYISHKGKCSIVRKVYAPIWVGGPLPEFVSNRTLLVGDAAGQSKPTTAGGIFTCGMGGIYAGKAIGVSRLDGSDDSLATYQKLWDERFRHEFEKMLLARKLLERLDNKGLDDVIAAIPSNVIEDASRSGDFDFHSSAVAKLLSTRTAAKFAKAMLGNELRRLFDKT